MGDIEQQNHAQGKSKTLRIAVLECGVPIGRAKERYGSFGTLFAELLTAGSELYAKDHHTTPPALDVSKFDVVNDELYPPSTADLDAILLTGSPLNAFDNDPWILKLVDYTKKVLEEGKVRVIGVCFGQQIVARALGSEVKRNEDGWEVAVVPVELNEKGREVLGLKTSTMAIHQMHRDIVVSCPPGVECLGSTSICAVQGMYKRKSLIAVQGHPEFNEAIETELIENRHEKGIFDEKTAKEALSRVGNHHDGVAIAAGFIKFLLDE